MSGVDQAVAALESLGLTQYEAKCFTALSRLSQGTAKEISDVADVPRSRVYDTLERLHDRGLVDVQESDPREYRAIPTEEALERLERDFSSRIDGAKEALSELESRESLEEEGVWAVADHGHVTDRIVALVDDAADGVHYLIAADRAVEESVLGTLQDAVERNVDVLIEVPTEEVRDAVLDRVPEADVVVASELQTTEPVVEKWPGQLLMVDEAAVLTSGIEDGTLPDVVRETAVWTSGKDHGFAAWTRELLLDRVTTDGSE